METDSNHIENGKCKLLMITKTVLNKISVKAKVVGHFVSLLNLLLLEAHESRYHNFKRAASRTESSQAQINKVGH